MTLRPAFTLAAFATLLTGCTLAPMTTAPTTAHVQGRIKGGQQPVSGATIQLYTVGTTAGAPSTPLLITPVTTLPDGSFDITLDYSCANATNVYLTATGGNPGLSQPNPNIAVMAALGPCTSLSASTFININELTTVAAVSALAPYMTSLTSVSAPPASAFATAAQLVDTATGLAPGSVAPPSGYAIPTTLLNTLADVVATCINSSGGTAGDSPATTCGQFFSLTTPTASPAPTDTVAALLNLAKNPTLNTPALFNLAGATPPFQPTLTTAPPDFRIREVHSASSAYVLQVGPSSLTFPSIAPGASTTQTVILSNTTAAAFTLSPPTLTGTNASEFTASTTCGTSLAAHAQCTVTVTATPQTAGNKSAYLAITSSSPDSPQYVQLTASSAAASPIGPQGSFRSLNVNGVPSTSFLGTSSLYGSTDYSFSNTGDATLTISSIALADGVNALTTNCPGSLAPGAACVATVHAIPATPPADQLVFTTNDPTLLPLYLKGGSAPTSSSISDLYFPSTNLGSTSATKTIPIPAYSNIPTLGGSNASDFIYTNNCTGGSLNNPACTATLSFKPTVAGERSAEFGNGSGGYLPLYGTGITTPTSTVVTLSATAVNFSDTLTPQALTLTNNGNSAVAITSLAVRSPLGATDFSQTNNCGTSLPAQSICSITVQSNRRFSGQTQDVLNITGDFGLIQATLAISNGTLYDFGSVLLGTSVTGLPTSTEFRGGCSIAQSTSGANAADFKAPNNASSGSVASCATNVTFTPSATGLRSAGDTITFNGAYPPADYLMLGTGVSTNVRDFTTTQAASTLSGAYPSASLAETITIKNTGTLALAFSSIAGYSDAQTTVTPTSGQCLSIAVGASCALSVAISSTQNGLIRPTLTFNSSTGNVTRTLYYIALVGDQVNPNPITFADTFQYDVSAPVSFTVVSNNRALISSPGSSDLAAVKSSCARNETPCILTYVYAPIASTTRTNPAYISTLDLISGASGSESVNANTLTPPPPAGTATTSPTSLTFPSRPVNSTSIPMTVTLSNTGAGPFAITSTGLSGTNSSEFSYTTTCGSSVAAGGSCTFGVTFAPTLAGSKTATLTINGDANAGLPLTVPITGTTQ